MASKIPLEFQVQLPPGSCIIYVVQSFLAVHTDTLWLDGLLVIVAPTLKVPKEIAAIVSLRRGSLYMTNTQILGLPEVGDTKNAVSRAVVVGADATNAYFHSAPTLHYNSRHNNFTVQYYQRLPPPARMDDFSHLPAHMRLAQASSQ